MSIKETKTIEMTEEEAKLLELTLRRLSKGAVPTMSDLIRRKYADVKSADLQAFNEILLRHKKRRKENNE